MGIRDPRVPAQHEPGERDLDSPGRIAWTPVGLAILETLFFWIVSAQIFSHVDIAVAVE